MFPSMNHGYHNNPEATAQAWRNGWFHTGDIFRHDADGNFFFVDRLKDCHPPSRREYLLGRGRGRRQRSSRGPRAAAVGVPIGFGEDDVLAVVAPVAGKTIDPVELLQFLVPRMAHFMVPRYVRVHARAAQDADAEGAEEPAARRRRHGRHLGPRGRRRSRQARAPVGHELALLRLAVSCRWTARIKARRLLRAMRAYNYERAGMRAVQ